MATLDILGEDGKAEKTVPHGNITDEQVQLILKDNEKHIKFPTKANAEETLDWILARENKGINCILERQFAKQYFNEPRFTPLRGMSLPEYAKSTVDIEPKRPDASKTHKKGSGSDSRGPMDESIKPVGQKAALTPKNSINDYSEKTVDFDVPF